MPLSEKNSQRMINNSLNSKNSNSKKTEKELALAINVVFSLIKNKYKNLLFNYDKTVNINDIVKNIMPKKHIKYHEFLSTSRMSPDGGIISLINNDNIKYPILISEAKTQGTNDKIVFSGQKRQAMGNAIERLGKNVVGFRGLLNDEEIFPFVCFADGCDFYDGSYIVDRVSVIFYFSELNKINLFNYKNLAYGSFFYKEKKWKKKEMIPILLSVAEQSINFYLSKYNNFGDING